MSLTVDKTATFTCDACGWQVHIKTGDGRPPRWANLDFAQGDDKPVSHDLCEECVPEVRDFMNSRISR